VQILQPGTTWLLAPVASPLPAGDWPYVSGRPRKGAIVAMKVVEAGGKLSLEPGWVSRDLDEPITPLIVNGVVFAVATGRPASAGPGGEARGNPAVLYALNGTTGKELWNSGRTITSFVTDHSFWAGNDQINVGTYDGNVYAFGFTMERR
jgi:outer membrane protein assembly factor BamB